MEKEIEQAMSMLAKSSAQWDEFYSSLSMDEQHELETAFNAIAERAALAAQYVCSRNLALSHADSVKRANKTMIDLRRSMGYSYPKLGEVSF
jgi:hypothetical protein